jgi:hypothetical protein
VTHEKPSPVLASESTVRLAKPTMIGFSVVQKGKLSPVLALPTVIALLSSLNGTPKLVLAPDNKVKPSKPTVVGFILNVKTKSVYSLNDYDNSEAPKGKQSSVLAQENIVKLTKQTMIGYFSSLNRKTRSGSTLR